MAGAAALTRELLLPAVFKVQFKLILDNNGHRGYSL